MASTSMAAAKPQRKPRLVYPKLGIPFILLVLCFAAWGSAANLTDVLVSVFRSIFTMSNFQSALVQSVRLLRRVLLAGHPGCPDQPAVRLQDRRAHWCRVGRGRWVAVHPGEQGAGLRVL